jgi:hypothetical protein
MWVAIDERLITKSSAMLCSSRPHEGLRPGEVHRSLCMCSCDKRKGYEGWCEGAYDATHGFFSRGCYLQMEDPLVEGGPGVKATERMTYPIEGWVRFGPLCTSADRVCQHGAKLE